MTVVLWDCPACHVSNSPQAKMCEGCGEARSFAVMVLGTTAVATITTPTPCPIDGGPLIMSGALKGFCVRMGGFPFTLACPFSCPLCRGKLDWTGGCQSCHGTTTGKREDWTFPGDGYYTNDVNGDPHTDGQHYVKEQETRPAASQKINAENARELARILGKYNPETV